MGNSDILINSIIVAAHPDDEALGCAGAIAKHVNEGDKVYIAFMADGVGSRDSNTGGSIKVRRESALKSSKILGAEDPIFFDFPDNQMDTVPFLNLARKIEEVVSSIGPFVVYTHHSGDLNIDHRLTHQAVMTACRPLPDHSVKKIRSFEVLSSTEWALAGSDNVFVPNCFIDISSTIEQKIEALKAYQHEMREFPHSRSIDAVIALARYRGASSGRSAAEAFFIEREIL